MLKLKIKTTFESGRVINVITEMSFEVISENVPLKGDLVLLVLKSSDAFNKVMNIDSDYPFPKLKMQSENELFNDVINMWSDFDSIGWSDDDLFMRMECSYRESEYLKIDKISFQNRTEEGSITIDNCEGIDFVDGRVE